MGANIRIPFTGELACRDTSLEKDSLITNAFLDQTPEGIAVVKRPGLDNKTSALGLGVNGALGLGLGVFFFNGKLYSWNSIDPGNVWSGFITDNNILFTSARENAAFSAPYVGLSISLLDELDTQELPLPTPFTGAGGWSSIVYTGTSFIMSSRIPSSTFPVVARSTDAVNWTTITIPTVSTYQFYAGAKRGSLLCIVNEQLSESLTSTDDGVTWTFNNIIDGDEPDGVFDMASNGTIFSVGTHHSTDGITWTTSTGSLGSTSNILWDGTRFFSITLDSIKTSVNGIAWSATTPTGSGAVIAEADAKVAWSGSRYVAMGAGYAAYSTNGTSWTLSNRIYSPTVIADEIVYFNNAFYALTHAPASLTGAPFNISYIEKSTDGVNWTRTIIDVALFDETPTIISGLA